jgi:hypothetical protein
MRKQDSDSQVSSPFGEAYSQQNSRWISDILEANLRIRKVFEYTSHSADFTTRIEAAVYSDRATPTFELAQLSDISGSSGRFRSSKLGRIDVLVGLHTVLWMPQDPLRHQKWRSCSKREVYKPCWAKVLSG